MTTTRSHTRARTTVIAAPDVRGASRDARKTTTGSTTARRHDAGVDVRRTLLLARALAHGDAHHRTRHAVTPRHVHAALVGSRAPPGATSPASTPHCSRIHVSASTPFREQMGRWRGGKRRHPAPPGRQSIRIGEADDGHIEQDVHSFSPFRLSARLSSPLRVSLSSPLFATEPNMNGERAQGPARPLFRSFLTLVHVCSRAASPQPPGARACPGHRSSSPLSLSLPLPHCPHSVLVEHSGPGGS